MTTKQLLEKLTETGCNKGKLQDYKIEIQEKNTVELKKKVDLSILSTEEKITKIHDRIDGMKTLAIVQLCGFVLMLLGLLFNIIIKVKGG